ncbi:MAG TPA: STAS domain-containing protein [Prolixibacteraceae bacterium]|nr:STAS domain-containing protein [Prolixibacteraceae bacterium]
MESVKFKKSLNEQGQITGLEIGGMLVLQNSEQLQNEFISVFDVLSDQVKITISEVDEIDLSCIQLFVAFIRRMDEIDVTYQFCWNIDEDQKSLLENVGLSYELWMSN